MFFESTKKKIRNRNILWSIFSVLMILLSIFVTVNTGFSADVNWQYGFRGIDGGIPIPNWLLSSLFVLMGLIFLRLLYSCMKDILKNVTYNELIKTAESIGDVCVIDETLRVIQKSELAKGDLRYNDALFFYRNGTEVFLLPTQSIKSVTPVTKSNKEFYVEVQSQDKCMKITVKKANLIPLVKDILSHIGAPQ